LRLRLYNCLKKSTISSFAGFDKKSAQKSQQKVKSVNNNTKYESTHQQSKDELVGAKLFHKSEIRN
jgi:hypothetical protein